MLDHLKLDDPEMRAAFLEDERKERLRSGKIASLLVVVLMPAGVVADLMVYGDWKAFLGYRLLCSLLAGVLWWLHRQPFGEKHYRALGLPIALLPAMFMSLIISQAGDEVMPYYAGLNLILLAVSVVVRWNVVESFLAVLAVLVMYSLVCSLTDFKKEVASSLISNNFYFLVLTGVIVVVGNFFFDLLRRSEFRARYKEKKSREALEENKRELEKAIEELHLTQAQLVEADRARTQARLGGFIVHNIGNALNYPITRTFQLRKKIHKLGDDIRPDFETAVDSVDSGLKAIKETIEAMRLLAYPDTKSVTDVPVSEVVRLAVLLTDYRWLAEGVEIHQDLAPDLSVRANKQLLIDAVINLIFNSLDAIRERTYSAEEKRSIWISARTESDQVIIRLKDNGPGIPKEFQNRIFERDFTTKTPGRGTGQGLASCRETVQAFGGTIGVQSEAGTFCEFTLAFPRKG